MIGPDGEIDKTKKIITNQHGELDWKSMEFSRIASPGIWIIEVTDGKNMDSIQLLVVPTPEELIKKYPTPEEIMDSYNQSLENKKPEYDVLRASSLEPFVDDGRQYLFKVLERGPAPAKFSQVSGNYKWSISDEFQTNDFGIVIFLKQPHEKYSIKEGKGLYLEDWIPQYIPDGQKLVYGASYHNVDDRYNLETHNAHYNFCTHQFYN